MARQKQVEPRKRLPTELADTLNAKPEIEEILYIPKPRANRTDDGPAETTLLQLIVCVSGIYASFLSWGVLQEALTTTTYTAPESPLHPNPPAERFTFSVFLNTVQSTFAALTGFLYLYFSSPKGSPISSPFPNKAILFPLVLVAISSSLASPFGYASLAHIDYLTFILAKSYIRYTNMLSSVSSP
ncbi:hypothetical protein KEM56_003926 [Ascosphaera pollenicola]|nr:hypothetical protein KEM56_003926 [Ascosphaera pollenicola]